PYLFTFFSFHHAAPTGFYTLSLHDALPICVLRGEIDNRVKGIVRGKVWVDGRAEPVVLELKGNAWPDLAGCLLARSGQAFPLSSDRKSTRLNSSHVAISYAVFCLKKKTTRR